MDSYRRPFAALLTAVACCWLAVASPAADAGDSGPGKAPNDPLFKRQFHLPAIQIPGAWAVSRGRGATVAVLDTGVAYEDRGSLRQAPDLADTRFVPGWDFVDGDSHPNDEPPPRRQSHGTHMAGIIAQTTDNGIGGAGVAPEAAIMPIRVLDSNLEGRASDIAKGLRYAADHGADVANLSIAGPVGDPKVEEAISYAASRGVTIVAAAGNQGRSSLSFPAAYPEVIAVGALSEDRTLAYYSNYGKGLDLVAPAGDRDPVSELGGVLQQTLKGGPATFCYCYVASTSAAAAEVSGAAALLVGSRRARNRKEVRSALLAGARDLGAPGPDPRFGAGLLQASSALNEAEGSNPRPTPPGEASGGLSPGWLGPAGAALVALLCLGLLGRRRRAQKT